MNNVYARFLDNCQDIERYYQNLVSLTKNHNYVGSTNEWIIDNYYLVVENKNIIKKEFKENKYLKILVESNEEIYNILLDIFKKHNYNLDQSILIKELNAYQNKHGVYFSYGTIKVIPIFIPIIIIDRLKVLADDKKVKQEDIEKVNTLIKEIEDDIQAGKEIKFKNYVEIDNYVLDHPTYLYHLNSNLKEFDFLSARLYYGVKTDIIPLVVGVKRLGRKRARNLVNIFGDNLSSASEKELQQVEGIGPKLAEKIVLFFK
jgi:predicted nucleic-acid-binding protein